MNPTQIIDAIYALPFEQRVALVDVLHKNTVKGGTVSAASDEKTHILEKIHAGLSDPARAAQMKLAVGELHRNGIAFEDLADRVHLARALEGHDLEKRFSLRRL